jgi:hypothetical protein
MQIVNNCHYEDVDLCVFISSKDRYGRTEDYKATILSLLKLSENSFKKRFLSIKIFKDDIESAQNIIKFFNDLNFNITIFEDTNISNEDRYLNRNKFIGGIAHDIYSFFLQNQNQFSKYVFVVEDDSPIIIKKNTFQHYLNKSIDLLESNKNIEGVHFLRLSYNEIPVLPDDWFLLHKKPIPDQSDEIYTDYWYNFQPRVNKTSDLLAVCNLIKNHWENYFKFLHPEDAFDKAYKRYNPESKSYAFSPYNAYSIHLGADPRCHDLILQSEKEIKDIYIKNKLNKNLKQ